MFPERRKSEISAIELEATDTLEVLIGQEVMLQLEDKVFQEEWDDLLQQCPWATVFQSKEFVATWYKIYQNKFLPILVKATSKGKLSGLLTLSRLDGGELNGAGGKHAEYQTWLSKVQNGDTFIQKALFEIRKRFPGSDVKLKFIPEKTPLSWIKADQFWRKRCVLRLFEQPLLVIDDESLNKELKKKNRKEKINRLKRLGELQFEKIEDNSHFLSIIDTLIVQYDFRNGARYNKIPSHVDPLRNELIIELFRLNILHATTLKLNNQIIASSVIAKGRNWLHLWGITSYDPSYAKHSPSILHYLMLGKLLVVEGIEVLDLTPGDDPYKKELATTSATAFELRVAGSYKSYLESRLINLIWNKLAAKGINRKVLKDRILKKLYLAKEHGHSLLFPALFRRAKPTDNIPLLVIFPEDFQWTSLPYKIYKNHLNDFLSYSPTKGSCSRWEFLESSMKRFESGLHSYTIARDGILLGCIWLATSKNASSLFSSYTATNSITAEGAGLLLDFYYHSSFEHELKDFLLAVTIDVLLLTNTNYVFAVPETTDSYLCNTLIETGFKYLNEHR